MWQSLKKVLVSLMIQYDIDPTQKQPYFTAIDKEPRLEVHEHTSLVGHNDTKNTACPGEHIIDRLPQLRAEVDAIKDILDNRKVTSLSRLRFISKPIIVRAQEDEETVSYPFSNRVVRSCVLLGKEVSLEQCGSSGEELIIKIKRADLPASGRYPLLVETDIGAAWIDLMVVRDDELDELLASRREAI